MTDLFDESAVAHIDVAVNGIRLHTVQAGPPDGRLLILLHGFPEFYYGWRAQIAPFAREGWRVVVPDQRGYNRSDKPAGVGAYAVDKLAGDVDGLVGALGRERAWLAGHDWGAAVAWEVALRYPQRLEKLGILNVPHPDVMSHFLQSSPTQMLKSWYIFFFQIPGLPEWMLGRRGCAGLRRMLLSSARPGTFSAADLDQYAAAWAQPGALTAMIHWYRAAFRVGLPGGGRAGAAAPRRVRVPTLMLWGMRDVALSAAMARPSIDLCDQGRLRLFERASHWVQHDEPVAVTAELSSFLAG